MSQRNDTPQDRSNFLKDPPRELIPTEPPPRMYITREKKESNIKYSQEDSPNSVINLLAVILSKEEINLLSKGLTFVPSTNADLFQTMIDVIKFIQDLTVKKNISHLFCLSPIL